METIKYSKETIEAVLNTLNSMEFVGFQNAGKLTNIYQILNSPIKDENNE